LAGHKLFCVQEVSVYQAGVEHPHKKGIRQWILFAKIRELRMGQGNLLRPGGVWLHGVFRSTEHPAKEGGLIACVPSATAVREAAVVPCYTECGAYLVLLGAHKGTRGGVIDPFRTALQPALECGGIFSQIVGKTCQFSLL
jgi:hypothetical protein